MHMPPKIGEAYATRRVKIASKASTSESEDGTNERGRAIIVGSYSRVKGSAHHLLTGD